MNNLTNQHYNATVKRGKITPDTLVLGFIKKMREEVQEVHEVYYLNPITFDDDEMASELCDVIATAANCMIHLGYNVEAEFKKNIEKQEQRND